MPTEFRTSEQLTDDEIHDLSLSDSDLSLPDNDLSPGEFCFALAIIAGLLALAIAGAFVD